jgi:magnesium chelatase family protein
MFPAENRREASIVEGLRLFPVTSLLSAAQILVASNPTPYVPRPHEPEPDEEPPAGEDLADVRGQLVGRRALEIAAAGGHHLLLCGPPGAGKTMLARRLPSILPPLEPDEALAVTAIHSVAGYLPPGAGLMRRPPFRAPHHTCSDIALVGGGGVPRPGELSLAHRGVLFLDELPEFNRRVLETLRQPLEQGAVHLARVARSLVFPAEVTLVGAMNPCPCGFQGTGQQICRCPAGATERYQRRLSGPLRDRFDLALDLPAVRWADLRGARAWESSAVVRARVVAARTRQRGRQGRLTARLDEPRIRTMCRSAGAEAEALLERAVDGYSLTARAVSRVLRVARTIADLDGAEVVESRHLAEALQLRPTEPRP